jgi:hypothetical protein
VALIIGLMLIMALGGVVVGGLVVKDQAIAAAETQLQTALGTPEPPTVAVATGGRPDRLLKRHIDRIDIAADDVGATNGQPLRIRHLDVRLEKVDVSDDLQSAVAQRVTGSAVIDYSALSSATGRDLSGAGDGRVAITMRKTVLGKQIDIVASGRPSLDPAAQQITFADTDVDVAGLDIPGALVRLVQSSAMEPVQLDGVPLGLKVAGLEVADTGVTAQLEGTDVVLSR